MLSKMDLLKPPGRLHLDLSRKYIVLMFCGTLIYALYKILVLFFKRCRLCFLKQLFSQLCLVLPIIISENRVTLPLFHSRSLVSARRPRS